MLVCPYVPIAMLEWELAGGRPHPEGMRDTGMNWPASENHSNVRMCG